jgi:hypothetical protein
LALRQIAHSFLLMGIVVRDIHKTATVSQNILPHERQKNRAQKNENLEYISDKKK